MQCNDFPPVSCGGSEAEVSGKLAVVAGEGGEALSGGEVPQADVTVVGARGYQGQPLGVCYQPEIMMMHCSPMWNVSPIHYTQYVL